MPTNRTSTTARYHPTTGFVNIGHVVKKYTLLTLQDIRPQRSNCPWSLCPQVKCKGEWNYWKDVKSVCFDHERSWNHFENVSLLGSQHISLWNVRTTISGWQIIWNQKKPIWLGVDFPITFCCRGNVDSKKAFLTLNFLVRSLPDGGSQYELIAIVTDVEENINEGKDGIEHMY